METAIGYLVAVSGQPSMDTTRAICYKNDLCLLFTDLQEAKARKKEDHRALKKPIIELYAKEA